MSKRILPRGWLGMGLACDCTVDAGKEHPLWTFVSAPQVTGEEASGPAARAGIRAGDRLLAIDGLRLDTPEGGRVFSMISPGRTVRFLLDRNGHQHTIEVVPEPIPPEESGVV